ncbi:MAG TPA: hypothetical protein ENI86_17575 [Acidimicrobiales bacterium]|nr:hypothetical protein [Acidimicrobiales bacterium]
MLRRYEKTLLELIELGEAVIYWAVSIALTLGGIVFFGFIMWETVRDYFKGEFTVATLELISGALLTLMLAQIVYTTMKFLTLRVIKIRPVLLVGIIAAVRRMLLIAASLATSTTRPSDSEFRQNVIEIGVWTGATLLLAVSTYLLRGAEDETADRKMEMARAASDTGGTGFTAGES